MSGRDPDRLPRELVTPLRLPFMRAATTLLGALAGLRERKVRGATGRPIWLVGTPRATPGPALLWIHGGGRVFGSPVTELRLARRIAARHGALVALPAYRFAPRDPYPAGLDDVSAAFDWLAAQPFVDPALIVIGGDSGGGGLAAALAIRLRDRKGVQPALQLLFEPMLDDRTAQRAQDPDDYRVWSPRMNAWAWTAYLKGAGDPPPPCAVPARLKDFTGLASAYVAVGERDLFRDESEAFAAALQGAGVATRFTLAAGMYHGFAALLPDHPESRRVMDEIDAELARAWAG